MCAKSSNRHAHFCHSDWKLAAVVHREAEIQSFAGGSLLFMFRLFSGGKTKVTCLVKTSLSACESTREWPLSNLLWNKFWSKAEYISIHECQIERLDGQDWRRRSRLSRCGRREVLCVFVFVCVWVRLYMCAYLFKHKLKPEVSVKVGCSIWGWGCVWLWFL